MNICDLPLLEITNLSLIGFGVLIGYHLNSLLHRKFDAERYAYDAGYTDAERGKPNAAFGDGWERAKEELGK